MDQSTEDELNRNGSQTHYDKAGKPIGLGTWVRLMEDKSYRFIAKTAVGQKTVSTVWLGLDHSFCSGPPLIFESMVFPECEDMDRYTTLAEAQAGHRAIVLRLMAADKNARVHS